MSFEIYRNTVQPGWIDYNGHLNDGYYAQVFSWATDEMMVRIGLGPDTRQATRHTIYTLETHVRFIAEVKLGAMIRIVCDIVEWDRKRLRILLTMTDESRDRVAATSEQLLISIDQSGAEPRTAPWLPEVATAIEELAATAGQREWPDFVGRGIALKR
ncbi:MAG: thioesterase family protein [Labrys sp. (in: a-proteobacteria)]|jgi:acyl-CoA thioester hydrolase